MINKINVWLEKNKVDSKSAKKILEFFKDINNLFDVIDFEKLKIQKIPLKIKRLAQEREKKRRNQKWQEADRIRKKIEKAGFFIKDTPKGPEIIKKAGEPAFKDT